METCILSHHLMWTHLLLWPIIMKKPLFCGDMGSFWQFYGNLCIEIVKDFFCSFIFFLKLWILSKYIVIWPLCILPYFLKNWLRMNDVNLDCRNKCLGHISDLLDLLDDQVHLTQHPLVCRLNLLELVRSIVFLEQIEIGVEESGVLIS